MSTPTPPSQQPPAPNEYERERREKRDKIRALGVDPYGQRTPNRTPLATAKAMHNPSFGQDGGPELTVAGRVMFAKRFGKLTFMTLRDDTGDLQVALDKKRLPELDWNLQDLIDLGDQIVVTGPLGATKTGEVTIWGKSLTFASKALATPPDKHSGLADIEQRYRQRYVDLYTNPDVMKTMQLRIRIIDEIRSFLKSKGYLEVETPMLQPLHGGANARPFITHHNALDMKLFMRIAPELYLKRLLVGGFSKVFEINRNFRNEGISPRHNPEFTMLEAYEAYGSWETMADLVEEMITTVAQNLLGTLTIEHKNAAGEVTRTINLQRPWRRVTMVDLVAERTGWRFDGRQVQDAHPAVLDQLKAHGSRIDKVLQYTPHEQLVETFEKLIEHTLIDPCYVTHVPSVIIPLAKESTKYPGFADVYELAINGVEISPGYTELNDPDVQESHFRHQVGDKEEQQQVDTDFLNALKQGMPPAGGIGLGIDRLVMMLLGAESIRDVILFPLMRPE